MQIVKNRQIAKNQSERPTIVEISINKSHQKMYTKCFYDIGKLDFVFFWYLNLKIHLQIFENAWKMSLNLKTPENDLKNGLNLKIWKVPENDLKILENTFQSLEFENSPALAIGISLHIK